MGFYSVTPGLDYYTIGTPLFDEATINLENGNQFIIKANKLSPFNKYIQSVKLNGLPYNKTYLQHADIINGGELIFEMGYNIGMWGTKVSHLLLLLKTNLYRFLILFLKAKHLQIV